jgi:hypothetical protein
VRAVVFILFILFVVVVAWFAMANSAPARGRRRVVRRPAPRRVVTRQRTIVEEAPEVVEERPPIAD